MGNKKKIGFGIIILFVVGSIWYLESLKVHPSASGQSGQAIDVNSLLADNTSTDATAGNNSTDTAGAVTPIVVSNSAKSAITELAASDKAAGRERAIEIAGPTGFINTPPGFTLSGIIGKKVILLDFWTYSCINCVRTIPYLNAWYQKYAGQGLEIVGIHTPEFDFEKDITNVRNAVTQYGVNYPVVLDSNYDTWNAYNNLYWPHEYLIDMAGYIVHDQVGEGSYGETEADIQKLLSQRAQILGTDGAAIPTSTVGIAPADLNEISSPETYFGAARNSLLANGAIFVNGDQSLTAPAPEDIQLNHLYLGGSWDFEDQYAKNLNAGATITYEYNAGNVYIVAAGAASGTTIDVLQDGKPVSDADAGSDVHNGRLIISGNRLYNLIKNEKGGGVHTLQLIIETPGLEAFTFTFG